MAKKQICLYFQVHQPARLRLYRFFDIGKDSHYYDDFANRSIVRRLAQRCYLPTNQLLLDLINANGDSFKVSFSISGTAIELFERYAPEVLDSFRELAATGKVEFLCETYYHSLASLGNPAEFALQVNKHKDAVKQHFGVEPVTFRNTELIYSDGIGEYVHSLGFKTMLAEGAKNVVGWRSPNFVYSNALQPKLKVILRNYSLSDDIAVRFGDRSWDEWPLSAEKYLSWIKASVKDGGNVVGLFMNYETFGERFGSETGIYDFLRSFVGEVIADGEFEFGTPASISRLKAVAPLEVPEVTSWDDVESDVTSWLGNELQQDAFNKVYDLYEKLAILNQPSMWNDFGHLQESDHFYYMSTRFFSDGGSHKDVNPYDTPYEAFINYMNVLGDFSIRVDDALLTFTRPVEKEKAAAVKKVVKKSAKKAAVKKK